MIEFGREALDYWPARHPAIVCNGGLVLAPCSDEPDQGRFVRRTIGYARLEAAGTEALEPDEVVCGGFCKSQCRLAVMACW